MRPQHFSEKESNLIFYCDCNNNYIDRVTGINFVNLITNNGTQFVTDPTDSTRYCAKKVSGGSSSNIKFCRVGPYNLLNDTLKQFAISKTTNLSTETATISWLCGGSLGNLGICFDWYPRGSNTRCIIDSTGLSNNNSNAQNSGVCIMAVNTTYYLRCRNNSSTNINQTIGTSSNLNNKWYTVYMDFMIQSTTKYKCHVVIVDKSTQQEIFNHLTQELTIPLQSNRNVFMFLSDTWGYGSWAQNTYDYIKEVKVYKLQQ